MKLNTERLFIRPLSLSDKESIFKYRSDYETSKHLSFIPKSVDDVVDFINKASPEIDIPGTWFQLAIVKKNSNILVGDIGIHFLDNNTNNKQVEIGYTLDKNYRGNGYATEAIDKVIDYLISVLKKHRIIASIDPENKASKNLVERLGFRKEAHFVKSLYFNGKWVDDLIYALLADEWKSKKMR